MCSIEENIAVSGTQRSSATRLNDFDKYESVPSLKRKPKPEPREASVTEKNLSQKPAKNIPLKR